jgi:hypothetical protein
MMIIILLLCFKELKGFCTYHSNSRTASFTVAQGILPAASKVTVALNTKAITYQAWITKKEIILDYKWTFSTAEVAPVTIYIRKKKETEKVKL